VWQALSGSFDVIVIAVRLQDGRARIWDGESGAFMRFLDGHDAAIVGRRYCANLTHRLCLRRMKRHVSVTHAYVLH
jgi:hypothetical protein